MDLKGSLIEGGSVSQSAPRILFRHWLFKIMSSLRKKGTASQ